MAFDEKSIEAFAKAWPEFKAKLDADESRRAEDLKALKTQIDGYKTELGAISAKLNRPGLVGGQTGERSAHSKAFSTWLRKGDRSPAEVIGLLTAGPEELKSALTQAADSTGYLAPTEFMTEMIKDLTAMNAVRQVARVINTGAAILSLPKRTGTLTAAWIGETSTRSETTGTTVGAEKIPVHETYAFVDIPRATTEDSLFPIESFIQDEFAEQFAYLESKGFVVGTGVGQPEGIMTNTSVDHYHNGHATELKTDGVLGLKYQLKEMYARNASFLMKRATVGLCRTLKDGVGNYVWSRPGLVGQPQNLDGDPLYECPDMDTVGSAAYPIAFGDFRKGYIIADRVGLEVAIDEISARTSGCIRYWGRRRVGGQVVLPQAIQKLYMAT